MHTHNKAAHAKRKRHDPDPLCTEWMLQEGQPTQKSPSTRTVHETGLNVLARFYSTQNWLSSCHTGTIPSRRTQSDANMNASQREEERQSEGERVRMHGLVESYPSMWSRLPKVQAPGLEARLYPNGLDPYLRDPFVHIQSSPLTTLLTRVDDYYSTLGLCKATKDKRPMPRLRLVPTSFS